MNTVLWFAAFVGCIGGGGKGDGAGQCPKVCPHELVDVDPNNGGSDVPYSPARISAEVSNETTFVWVEVIGPDGTVDEQNGLGSVVFDVELEPDTEYTLKISWACETASDEPCAHEEQDFHTADRGDGTTENMVDTTSGVPFDPTNVRGRVYRLVGSTIGGSSFVVSAVSTLDVDYLFYVEEASATSMTAWFAEAEVGGAQNPCFEPVRLESEVTENGSWSGGGALMPMFYEGDGVGLRSWTGRFEGDGSRSVGGEVEMYVDARAMGPYVGTSADGVCDLFSTFGVECTSCPEVDGDYCITSEMTNVETTAEGTLFDINPDCGSY